MKVEVDQHTVFLVECVREVDVEAGVNYLLDLRDRHGERYAAFDVVNNFLSYVGEQWNKNNTFSLADAYVCSKIVVEYFEALDIDVGVQNTHKKAVFGNIRGDFQSSGRKIVIKFLRIAGWEIVDLGNDVEPSLFIETAKAESIHFIGVSAMLYENALHIKELVQRINETYSEEEKPYLIVGGAVFNVAPNLAQEIGVNYTASNAYEAIELFDHLAEVALDE